MTRKDDRRAETAERLKEHLLANGLSQSSLRQLAAAAGISDRMLLYYFDDKTDAVRTAISRVATELTIMLDTRVPEGSHMTPRDLIREVSALTLAPETRPYFRLWAEAIAGAVRDPDLYGQIVHAIAAGFLDWIERRLEEKTPGSRRADAAMILAMIDGLALLEICTDADTARLAARRMWESA